MSRRHCPWSRSTSRGRCLPLERLHPAPSISLATFFGLKARLNAAFNIVNSRLADPRSGALLGVVGSTRAWPSFHFSTPWSSVCYCRSPSFGGLRLSRRSVSTPVFLRLSSSPHTSSLACRPRTAHRPQCRTQPAGQTTLGRLRRLCELQHGHAIGVLRIVGPAESLGSCCSRSACRRDGTALPMSPPRLAFVEADMPALGNQPPVRLLPDLKFRPCRALPSRASRTRLAIAFLLGNYRRSVPPECRRELGFGNDFGNIRARTAINKGERKMPCLSNYQEVRNTAMYRYLLPDAKR